MTKYQDDITIITEWSKLIDQHWHRCQGELYNDKTFWHDCIHDMPKEVWWSWVDIEPALKIQHEEIFRRFPKISDDTNYIRQRLMLGKTFNRKGVPGENTVIFRTVMTIHDIINDIEGTPTKRYVKPQPQETLTPFEVLFDV